MTGWRHDWNFVLFERYLSNLVLKYKPQALCQSLGDYTGLSMSVHFSEKWSVALFSFHLFQSYKTPTSLLTKGTHKQEFVAFGYEAEERFADQDEDDAGQLNLFKKFKMILHQKEV